MEALCRSTPCQNRKAVRLAHLGFWGHRATAEVCTAHIWGCSLKPVLLQPAVFLIKAARVCF